MTRLNEPRSNKPEPTGWLRTFIVVIGLALFAGLSMGVTALVRAITQGAG